MTPFAIALGANMGDRLRTLRGACVAMEAAGESRIIARSRVYETAPVGVREQPPFLNAVVLLESGLAAAELMEHLHEVERAAGRRRESEVMRWGPRTLDLDIVLAGEKGTCVLLAGGVAIPHPRAFERLFVLVPLADVAPAWMHPITGERVDSALRALRATMSESEHEPRPISESLEVF